MKILCENCDFCPNVYWDTGMTEADKKKKTEGCDYVWKLGKKPKITTSSEEGVIRCNIYDALQQR